MRHQRRSEQPFLTHRIAPGSGFPKLWDDFAPAWELNKALHLMVDWDPKAAVGNDANLAALAESTWGAGRGSAPLSVEWSEGIGGGLVFDGELFAGAHGGAAEFGHYRGEVSAPYPCSSGHLNCLEAVAATSAMLRQAQDQSSDDGPENFGSFWQLVREEASLCTHSCRCLQPGWSDAGVDRRRTGSRSHRDRWTVPL